MADKEVKTENFEHCIESQSLCLGFTSSNVPHLSVAKTIAQEAPRFLLFYQKSNRSPNYVQALFLAPAFNFFLKRPASNLKKALTKKHSEKADVNNFIRCLLEKHVVFTSYT